MPVAYILLLTYQACRSLGIDLHQRRALQHKYWVMAAETTIVLFKVFSRWLFANRKLISTLRTPTFEDVT